MGLFSKLRKSGSKTDTSLAKAVLVPSVMTMISDGSIDKSEIEQLANLCSFSPIFASLPADKTVALINEIINDLTSGDPQAVITNATNTLSMPLRETSMVFAMRIAMADGVLDDGEKQALAIMGQQFGIEENKFMVMFDVVAMMQRGPQAA